MAATLGASLASGEFISQAESWICPGRIRLSDWIRRDASHRGRQPCILRFHYKESRGVVVRYSLGPLRPRVSLIATPRPRE